MRVVINECDEIPGPLEQLYAIWTQIPLWVFSPTSLARDSLTLGKGCHAIFEAMQEAHLWKNSLVRSTLKPQASALSCRSFRPNMPTWPKCLCQISQDALVMGTARSVRTGPGIETACITWSPLLLWPVPIMVPLWFSKITSFSLKITCPYTVSLNFGIDNRHEGALGICNTFASVWITVFQLQD